jgi:hypothetical protein
MASRLSQARSGLLGDYRTLVGPVKLSTSQPISCTSFCVHRRIQRHNEWFEFSKLPDPNTATNRVLKDGAAFTETAKLLWLGIGTGDGRPRHFGEPSAHSARCWTRAGVNYVHFVPHGTTHERLAFRQDLIDLASSPSSQLQPAHFKTSDCSLSLDSPLDT